MGIKLQRVHTAPVRTQSAEEYEIQKSKKRKFNSSIPMGKTIRISKSKDGETRSKILNMTARSREEFERKVKRLRKKGSFVYVGLMGDFYQIEIT